MSADQAVGRIRSGDTVMVGGFGLVGCPLELVAAVLAAGVRDLVVVSNNLGEPGAGLGELLRQGRVRKAIGSYFTSNPDVAAAYRAGELEVEVLPQGTLAESIRAGGAGIGGFYVPAGADTAYAEGREVREIRGRRYVFQEPLHADVALVRAHRADHLGNLTYSKSTRNFNPVMATAADLVIAQVDDVVPVGALPAEHVVTPHLFVDHVVPAKEVAAA